MDKRQSYPNFQKNVGSKKILDPKEYLVQRILVCKKFLIWKKFWSEKNIWSETKFGSEKIWRSGKMCSLKIFLGLYISKCQGLGLSFIFHRRSFLSKVVFQQLLSFIKGCLPSKVIFHQRTPSAKGNLPLYIVFIKQNCLKESVSAHFILPLLLDCYCQLTQSS